MNSEFEKTYDPKAHEDAIYRNWEESGFFNPDKLPGKHKEAFSIVLPPPNVTGTLHMGHAAMIAVEDIIIRYRRMSGAKTLWIPGTDHAAIATQEKVEKELYKKEKKTRHDLGRETFLKQVEEFASASHDTIVHQMKRLGASLDWSREAFTLDESRSLAVKTAFKEMHEAGLIYRGDRIVNWDPKLQTTVSDDEVEWKDEKSVFYYIQYGPFVIGTARPETKFGDKYVVMHPNDERYAKYKHGETLEVEWINGRITATIIKDEAADPEFGTGVMTITPWHDAMDFEIAERHNLDKEQIIDLKGKLLPIAGEFAGMHITKARPAIVEKLKEKKLLVKVDEEYAHRVTVSTRGGGIIEPQIMRQWFVDVNKKFEAKTDKLQGIKKGEMVTLKEMMLQVVKSGQIKIIPEHFDKTYFHWIENLRDWCISRQLWYGHRIPAWYCTSCKDEKINPLRKGKWFFARHGETDFNKEGRQQGWLDTSLNEKGREQAREMAHALKNQNIDLIISSDLKRAKETAEIIHEVTGAEIIYEKGFRERNHGGYEGMLKEEMIAKYQDRFGYDINIENDESYKQLEDRVVEAFERHKKKHAHKNVVIMTHGGTIRMLMKRINNWTPEQALSGSALKNTETIQFDILEECKKCGNHLFLQDSDTLDTWFSSGLWTLSTLGWPEKTADLKGFHPTSVLETGYDILFFWIARMILMTGFLIGDVPFKTVYLHGLVRDEKGRKMSKSLGNGIDPLEMADKYGADATRLSLIVGAAPGNDIKLSEDKIRGYRNFATKIWNIARFISMYDDPTLSRSVKMPKEYQAYYDGFNDIKKLVTEKIEAFELHEAANESYHYIWHTFADIVIEQVKPALQNGNSQEKAAALAMLKDIFLGCIKLLHPFMPFVTEAVYQKLFAGEKQKSFLMVEAW
ncbi:MAG: class I tRNA ligase family protein [Patescibacteria group bacterium]